MSKMSWTAAGIDLAVQPKSQHCWTRMATASNLAKVMSALRPKRLAHVTATSQPHSGDWLKAIPVRQIRNRLNNDST